MKGGSKVAEDMKKPCEPMEEAGRDYNELGIFRYKEKNPTLETAQTLWAFLPAWMAARDMASVDAKYKVLSAAALDRENVPMEEWLKLNAYFYKRVKELQG